MRIPGLSDKIATWIPRGIGILVGWVGAWIYGKTKGAVQIDSTVVADQIVVGLGSYATTHRILSTWLNPGDAAVKEVVAQEKAEKDTVKVTAKSASGI